MARLTAVFVGVVVGAMVLASDALAVHNLGHPAVSSGIPWDTVALWGGIGVAVVLLAAWLAFEGRRRHWLSPHGPVPHA